MAFTRRSAATVSITVGALLSSMLTAHAQANTPASGSVPQAPAWADLRVDANRDGSVDITGATDAAKTTANLRSGALFLPNLDDDAGRCKLTAGRKALPLATLASCNDAADLVVNGPADEADLAPLRTVPNASIPTNATGRVYVRTKMGAARTHLFLKKGTSWTLLRPTDRIPAAALRAGLVLGLEGTDLVRDAKVWDGRVSVTFEVTAAGRTVSDTVALQQAPLLGHDATQPIERMLISASAKGPDVSGVTKELTGLLASSRIPLSTLKTADDEIWTQDLFEPMTVSMPGAAGKTQRIRVLVLSDQQRPAAASVFALRGRDVAVAWQGPIKGRETLDSMGNLEFLPPHRVGTSDRPLGRAIMGYSPGTKTRKTSAPTARLQNLLHAQTGVAPLLVDTGWLEVAHIDEIMHVAPASSARGWQLVVADPQAAIDLLKKASAAGHGKVAVTSAPESNFGTIAEVVADKGTVGVNTLAATRIAAALQSVKAATGLTDADIIRVPVLFTQETNPDRDPSKDQDTSLSALLPNAVNGVVLGRDRYLAAKQFGPMINGRDLFADAVSAAYAKAGLTVSYVDTFGPYHTSGGEIHCGTNALRTATAAWWRPVG